MNGTKTRAPDAEMPMLEADAAEIRIDWLLEVGFVVSLPVVLMPSSLSHGAARRSFADAFWSRTLFSPWLEERHAASTVAVFTLTTATSIRYSTPWYAKLTS